MSNSQLEAARITAKRLTNNVYKSLDKIILAMPPEQLDFKATPENMSFKHMAMHIYQTAYVFTKGIETGRIDFADLQHLSPKPEEVHSAEQIVQLGQEVKALIGRIADELTEEGASRAIESKFGNMTALRVFNVLLEEAIHHRGQLGIYLRLCGIKPPSIYDYS